MEQSTILPDEVESRELLKFYMTNENPLTTFTDKQLQNDRRTRISTALFEAGLLDSQYARNILSDVPLNKPPAMLMQISQPNEPMRRLKKEVVLQH